MSTRPTTHVKLEEALSRLLAGQPTVTDGELTVSNLCTEAGVGRDSFYRTDGMAEKFRTARDNAETTKPEVIQLRDQIAELKRKAKRAAKEHNADLTDLAATIKIYANQIQALALANETMERDNRILRERLENGNPDLIQLAGRR